MAMEILPTIKLVPDNLRNRPIFQKVSAILDFITLTNHYENVEEMASRFDIEGDAYDPSIGSDEFGATEIKAILKAAGAAIEDRSLVGLTRMVYRLKGTSRGLVFILRLLGINATVYEGTRVHREIELQTANGVEWADDPELATLDNCEILLGINTDVSLAPDILTEAQLLLLAREFMWVCSNIIGFKVGIVIKNVVKITQDVEEQINEDIRQPFRVGKLRDYPYPPFDIGGFYIGQGVPRPDPYPVMGGHHHNKPLNSLDGYYDLYDLDFEVDPFLDTLPVVDDQANYSEIHHDTQSKISALELELDFEIEALIETSARPTTSLSFDMGEVAISNNISEVGRNNRGMPLIGGFDIGNPDTQATAKWIGGSNIHAHDTIEIEWVD